MDTYLITGVTGFLGRGLARHLLAKNFQIIGLGRQSANSIPEELKNNPNFIYLEGAITYENLLRLNAFSIKGVFHLASQIPSNNSISYSTYYEANVLTTHQLISYFQNSLLDFFVYTSTNSVFGMPTDDAISENSIPTPLNYYGLTKYISEKLIEIESANWKTKSIIIRLCSLFGPEDTYGFMHTISNEIRSNLEVELFSQGSIYRALLHIDDAIKLLTNMIDMSPSLETFEIFQAAGDESYQTVQIAQSIKKHLNSDSIITLSDRKSRYDWNVFIDISKTKNKLAFQPMPMEEGIELYLNAKK